ncbi:TrkH family potassium uptake protein [uncultured Ruthenibacterium sp.]|uniref:TrkH family potassium uptake protein n=1 Tax=uncultured Ruthenibacterium sp. TaxID=1905347 RepID=UPI00349E7946
MNIRLVGRMVSSILFVTEVFMIPSLVLCCVDGDHEVAMAFLASMAVISLIAGALYIFGRKRDERFSARDGFVTVALAWVLISLLCGLPFYFSSEIPSYVDAVFEIVSGFTTTGASVLPDVESLSRGVLYWRSFSHWLGGMGILVFTLAVVPANRNSGGTLYLMRAESPGPSVGKLTPRIRQTAMILYGLYILLTILCIVFLLAGGMPLFDSVCTAFGTAGTGGFGIKNDSMASYSPYLQNVCTVFMLLFGVNFNVYFLLLIRKFSAAFKDEEVRLYLFLFASATGLIAWNIRPMMQSFAESLHHAAFQVSSIMTTTGFSTVNFDVWPSFSKSILLILMALGACAGSTGGGIKTVRLLLLVKELRYNVQRTLQPRSVRAIHVNGRVVDKEVITGVNSYMAAYCLLIFGSILLISLDDFSLETNISAVFACFNNIGPGFDVVGPMANYDAFSDFSKIVLTVDMLLGRLEIFPLLALFSRSAWTKKL